MSAAGEQDGIDAATLAAIVAAVEATWPRPGAATGAGQVEPDRWRFSARWWSQPVASRRGRPW